MGIAARHGTQLRLLSFFCFLLCVEGFARSCRGEEMLSWVFAPNWTVGDEQLLLPTLRVDRERDGIHLGCTGGSSALIIVQRLRRACTGFRHGNADNVMYSLVV